MSAIHAKRICLAIAAYWLVFGLITAFYPALMDLFQTREGVAMKSAFSNDVWRHGGFDILGVCVLVFAISRLPLTSALMRAVGIAAFLPCVPITLSLLTTPFWSPLFIVAGAGCFALSMAAFVVGARLAK